MCIPISLWLLVAISLGTFALFPFVDLAVSGLFYEAPLGFVARGRLWERLVYHSVTVLMYGVNLALIGWCIVRRWIAPQSQQSCARQLAYLLLLLALAPGLIVNALFKEHWGRPRPAQVVELGGEREFRPPFLPSDQGGGSFSSGHAAAAAYLVVVAWVNATRRRRFWTAIAAGYTLLVGFARIAAGGHFLSDVLTSYAIVAMAALVLHQSLFGESLLSGGQPPTA